MITPRIDLRKKLGFTPCNNFFLMFWTPILGPVAAMIYLQILRLAGREKSQVTISMKKLKDLVNVADNRTFKNYLTTLSAYGFIVYESNNEVRYKHRLIIIIEDLPMYLDAKDVVKLPIALQKKYHEFIAMSHLTLHEFLFHDDDIINNPPLPSVEIQEIT